MAKPKKPKKPKGEQAVLKLTSEVREQIVASLRKGSWFATAAEAAGIDRETAKGWRRIGEGCQRNRQTGKWSRVAKEGPEPYRSFSVAVARALGHADERDEQVLAKHALEDWRAAAFRLERRNPRVFAERLHVEVKNKVQQSQDAFLRDLEHGVSPGAYAEVVSFIARRMGVQSGGGAGTSEAS